MYIIGNLFIERYISYNIYVIKIILMDLLMVNLCGSIYGVMSDFNGFDIICLEGKILIGD